MTVKHKCLQRNLGVVLGMLPDPPTHLQAPEVQNSQLHCCSNPSVYQYFTAYTFAPCCLELHFNNIPLATAGDPNWTCVFVSPFQLHLSYHNSHQSTL
jgi:hypothetical protein